MAKPAVKSVLKKTADYKVAGTLWMECDGERFFGPGRIELLERIAQTGSINKAAKQMGMSYKKAWLMISSLNTQTSKPLVVTQAGGEKGGGSTISDEARQLIVYHNKLRQRFMDFLKKETIKLKSG